MKGVFKVQMNQRKWGICIQSVFCLGQSCPVDSGQYMSHRGLSYGPPGVTWWMLLLFPHCSNCNSSQSLPLPPLMDASCSTCREQGSAVWELRGSQAYMLLINLLSIFSPPYFFWSNRWYRAGNILIQLSLLSYT